MADQSSKRPAKFQGPKGTRDFYPREMARRRYIEQAWRRVSIRHGFDEIEGPTFESSDLYAVKSGEGILGELFQAFSGKSPEEVAQVQATGRAPYALRPEFTPTLARMFAEKAASLPRPTKWFAIPIHYRAERPQRGRLREFLQWNVDLIGGDPRDETEEAWNDIEVLQVIIGCLRWFGLTHDDVQIRINDRRVIASILCDQGVEPLRHQAALQLLDRATKLSLEEYRALVRGLGLPEGIMEVLRSNEHTDLPGDFFPIAQRAAEMSSPLHDFLSQMDPGDRKWFVPDLTVVRGLAYYTGRVFEVVAKGERAIAGGGRYDTLIENFGGPATPAVGFGMGDVVLSLVLEDKGLFATEDVIADQLGLRPDVFVISAQGGVDDEVIRMVEVLREGGLHARRSYKATKNIDKLLKDAAASFARCAIIIDDAYSAGTVAAKDLADGSQHIVKRDDLLVWIRGRVAGN